MRFSPWFLACFHKPLTLAAQELLYIISFRLSSSFFKFFSNLFFCLAFGTGCFQKHCCYYITWLPFCQHLFYHLFVFSLSLKNIAFRAILLYIFAISAPCRLLLLCSQFPYCTFSFSLPTEFIVIIHKQHMSHLFILYEVLFFRKKLWIFQKIMLLYYYYELLGLE